MGVISTEAGKLRTQREEGTDRTQRNGKIKGGGERTERSPGSRLKDGLRLRRMRKVQKPREVFHAVGSG